MSELNKCLFQGGILHFKSDTTKNGNHKVSFTLCNDQSYKNKDNGEKVKKTEWINCISFGERFRWMENYYEDIRSILIEGKYEMRKYTNQEGIEVKSPQFQLNTVNVLSWKDKKDKSETKADENVPDDVAF